MLHAVRVRFAVSGNLAWRWMEAWSDGCGDAKFDKKGRDLLQLFTIVSFLHNRNRTLEIYYGFGDFPWPTFGCI